VLTAADCTEVNDAALATEMNLEPAFNGYSPEAPVSCNTFGTVPEPLYFNDLESGVGDFDFSSDAPVNEALIWDSGYAWSGTRMIWADDLIGDDYGLTGIDTIATLTNDVNLTGGSEYYLHFWHAWGLEEYLPGSSTIYDGAVVEYSTNGGSSWTDIGPLFEDGKDYDGTITTAFDNPLKGRQAFAYDSHGYVSSRYDLSSLAGQNVRFRWRLGTDDVNGDVGWVIDDILVYTCSASAPLTASVTCNNPNLEVTITGGDGPFNITVSEGQNMPVIGVNTGTTVVLGPDRWRNITVTETTGDSESIVLESKLVCRSTENTILLAPPHRSRTTDTTPFFDWTDTTDANLYRIFIFDNKVQADRTVDIRQNNSLSQWTATPALPTQRLFWRARARVNHAWGYWSVRWTLFIDPVAPVMLDGPPQDGAMPSTPVLSTPVVVTPGSDGVEVPPAPTDVPTEAPTDLPPPPNSR
jgi:hypothetical protein